MSFPELIRLEGIVIPDDATIENLKAAGEYDSESQIAEKFFTSEHFKITVHGPRDLLLAYFGKKVSDDYAEAVGENMGYEMALVEDLLCVGAHSEYCELQRQFSIVALGSSADVDDHRLVPILSIGWHDTRHLQLSFCGGKWSADCRFLFVDNSGVVA